MLSLVALTACPGVARAGDEAARSDRLPKITPRVRVKPAISDSDGSGVDVRTASRLESVVILGDPAPAMHRQQLHRSFALHPYLDGQIDEFRIYNRVLSSVAIGVLAGH
jgi:hypothetical protein